MVQRRIVETTLRVRYAETDAMGVVYHANYFVWFEVGRGDWFRAFGQDYGEWETLGYFLPVSEAHARFHAPARYADVITLRTRIKEARSRGVTLGYEVLDAASQKRLVSGWTRHICMNHEGQACRLPGNMQKLVEQA
jgi:acyl-CoA thioester hydrolase